MNRPDLRSCLSEAIIVLDATGTIVEVAPFGMPGFRQPPGELEGERFETLFTVHDRSQVRDARLRCRQGMPSRVVARLDGPAAWRIVDVRFHALDDNTQETVAVARDASSVVDVGTAARLLRRITELANKTSDSVATNVEALEDVQTTLGWPDARIVTADEPPVADDPASAAVEHAFATRRAVVLLDADQRSVLAIPVVTAVQSTTALVLRSATREQLDEGFLDIFSEVGRQLGHVTDRRVRDEKLAAMSDELRRSNSELERFAYVASHDLQEPIRKILGFAKLLEERYAETLDDQAKQYLHYMLDAAERQKTLINDLLAYSRIGRDSIERETIDLARTFRNVEIDLADAVAEAGARILVRPLPAVVGNAPLLRDLVTNLLSNALKYRRPDHPPNIEVSAHAREDGSVELSVADDGIGIGPTYREQVFEVFRRLHTRTEYPGTGIGLAICRRIVEQHGGRIWVQTSSLGGTDVRFTLPLANEGRSDEQPSD